MSNIGIDFGNLVPQGRAKAHGVCWSEAELKALDVLIKHTGLARSVVADYVRAGILTPKAYDEAIAKGLTPKEKPAEFEMVAAPDKKAEKKEEPKEETPEAPAPEKKGGKKK